MSREKIDIQCKEVVKGVAGAILEQIPVVNFFVSAVGKVKDGVLQRRYDSWQEMVGERLATLEDAVFNSLGDNETFVTTFVKTTELVAQSNQKKMELLANAVKCVANNDVEEDYIIVFLKYIEGYSLSHLRLIRYFNKPNDYYIKGKYYEMPSPMTLYKDTYSTSPKDEGLLRVIVRDLQNDGLLDAENLYNGTIPNYALAPRTTEMGRRFIDFFGLNDVEL